MIVGGGERSDVGIQVRAFGSNTGGGELAAAPPLIRDLVLDLEQTLSGVLESGAATLHATSEETLVKCRDRLYSLGVKPLAESLDATLKSRRPAEVLRAAYRLQLFRQALRLQLGGGP